MAESIFKGQILTVSIVITFLAVFLLREWIFQNAGPGPNQEVENGRVPRPEEFRANMRALWRRRQLQNVDHEDPAALLLDPAETYLAPLNDLDPVRNQDMRHQFHQDAEEPGRDHDHDHDEDHDEDHDHDHDHDEDDQWVDEEEWIDDDGNAQDQSSERIANEERDEYIMAPRGESTGTSVHQAPIMHNHDVVQEQGPAPSLLQQLRRQHREHGDPNMSFEEFLLYQRHNMTELPNREEMMNEDAGMRAMLPPHLQPGQSEEQIREAYMHFFADPNDAEDFRRQLRMDFPFIPEDRRENQRERREIQLRRAARDAEREELQMRANPFRHPPRRDHAREAAAEFGAEAEVGDVVEMGPEPGFDEDDADDEGGLIIDGDVDGILEGDFGSISGS